LIGRSISAADAIGKTAEKIGGDVEALQKLRFADKASGVEHLTLDMALQPSPVVRPRRRRGRAAGLELFDSEGVALVNLLRGGSGALEEMRDPARDLGIVLDEHRAARPRVVAQRWPRPRAGSALARRTPRARCRAGADRA
jgi:hypothetical protein